jgi:hypothetical protein
MLGIQMRKSGGFYIGLMVLIVASVLTVPITSTQSASALTSGIVATGLALNLDPNITDSYPGSGLTVTDLSGANRHGTLAGNALPTFNNVSPKSFQFMKTKVGNTASADNKIRVSGKFLTDNFTIQTWIKTSEVGWATRHYTTMYIMASECGGGADDWGFGVNNSGKLAFGAGRNDATYATPDNVNTNTWVNVAASRNKSTGQIRLYINGVLKTVGTGNSGNSLTCSADGNTWIGNGQDSPAYTFGGSIGTVLAYTNILSDADVLTNYNATSGTYAPVAPALTAVPVIEGTARNGNTLTSSTGSWTGTPTSFSYQWSRALTSGGVYSDIAAATNPTYVVSDSDVGYFIKVAVVATNSVGSSPTEYSLATSACVEIAPVNTAIPVIAGIARTASTLAASSTGSWIGTPTSYAYQWKRSLTSGGSFSDIAAATSPTYVANESDVGYFIKVAVIAANSVGSSIAVESLETLAVVDIAPTNTAIPAITGVARTGETLTASKGSWTSSPSASTTYTYQWKRASTVGGSYTNIASATDRTYDLTDADIDNFIKVSVIATNNIGASSAVLSVATSVVIDLTDSVVPTVSASVSTATGFKFSILNYSANYTYALTTTEGTVSRSTDDVTVTGLTAGESATVTIAVTRSGYKPASKTVAGSAIPAATTTTTAAPALSIVIQAPATTVAQGQISVATVAPTTTTLPTLAANGVPVPTTTTSTTVAPARARTVVTTTLPRIVTTTTLGPPVVDKVDAGQSAVQVDGVKTDAVVTRSNNQMVVTSGSLSATLSGLDKTGKRAALDSNGVVHLDVGDVIKISLGGFKPESIVEVWLFSTPTKLGTAEVGKDGKMSSSYKLPFGTKSGAHRVVVTAKLPNGKSTTFTLGILVGDISTTSTLTRVLIAIPITLAIGFGFLLPTQLRRRKTRIA